MGAQLTKNDKRTCYAAELIKADIGKHVCVMGWVQRQRDLGSLIFVDLRDRSGIIQLAFDEKTDKEIFDAAPSKTAQLTNNTLLGTFKKAGSTELTVTLTVPAEMGNQYMGAIGVVPWTFMVEEIPEDPSVHTGDWFQAGLWIGAAALLAAAVIVLIVLQRKRRKEA